MSLIYQSLNKLRQKSGQKFLSQFQRQRKAIGVLPKTRQLLIRFFIFIILTTLGLSSVYFLVKYSLNALLDSSQVHSLHSKIKTVGINSTNSSEEVQSDLKKQKKKRSSTIESSFRLDSPPMKKIPRPNFPRPIKINEQYTLTLKHHFSRQSKRNIVVFNLQEQLRKAYLTGSKQQFFMILKKINKLLGKNNLFCLKWEGVWELRAKHFDRAAQLFRKALNINPEDKTCRINLIYALIGQKQYTQAKKELNKLEYEYLDDPKVKELYNLLRNL